MEIPQDLLYTPEHEWIRVDGNRGEVGITHFAQDQLGDVVFVEIPKEGTALEKEGAFGVVESVKTVSDLYSPVNGNVVKGNQDLEAHPEWVNEEPYGKGWMIQIEIKDPKDLETLMSPEQYAERLKQEME